MGERLSSAIKWLQAKRGQGEEKMQERLTAKKERESLLQEGQKEVNPERGRRLL